MKDLNALVLEEFMLKEKLKTVKKEIKKHQEANAAQMTMDLRIHKVRVLSKKTARAKAKSKAA